MSSKMKSASTVAIRGQESGFLSIFQIRRGEMVVCAADESEVLDAGLENHVVNRLDAPTDEIAQRERRRGQAQASMEIRPTEVGVDHDHFLAVQRHGDPKAARNEALANAAFAAANCNDATFGGLRFLARCRRNHWMHDRRGRGFGKVVTALVPRIFNYYTKSGSPCVSSVRWAKRAIDSRIWSADLVHLNGFGSSLWASR